MVDKISIPTYKQIEVLLSNLAKNYSELASSLYDVFFNEEPMDVTFKMYNEAGVLQEFTIPNRAKDMEHILNGNGSPEGAILASMGDIYQDLEEGALYIKETADGTTGWNKFATEDYLSSLLIMNVGSPEGIVSAGRGTLYIDTAHAALYIKTTITGSAGWEIISASTRLFADIDLSNLSTEGQAIIDSKEDKANKVTSITSNSTNEQYPSALGTYNFVNEQTSGLANKDLSNLSESGENRFADLSLSNLSDSGKIKFTDWAHVKSGILYTAPNGLIRKGSGNADFVIPQGMVLLLAAGLNDDKTLKNIVSSPLDVDIEDNLEGMEVGDEGFIFYDGENRMARSCTRDNFIVSNEMPSSGEEKQILFMENDNQYYYWDEDSQALEPTSAWITAPMALVGEFRIQENLSSLTSDAEIIPYYPIRLSAGEKGDLTGVVRSVNNIQPINGNVTLEIPSSENLADRDLSNLTTIGQAVLDSKADNILSNVIAIDSNSPVQVALNGKANTSLSNLSSAGQAIISGKADRTLSNVSSIASTSAVSTALNGKANTSLSNLNSTGQAKFDAKVNKAGDTMTGNLTLSKSAPYIYLKNTAQTAGSVPSSTLYEKVDFIDKNEKSVGAVGNRYNTDGSRNSYLCSTDASGENALYIRVGYDASGNEFFSFPKCTTKATKTSTATTARVAVVVQNYVNGKSWYRVWSDSWIEQGGYSTTWNSKTSFIKNFSDTNYTILLIPYGTHDCYENACISSVSTSGFIGYEKTDRASGFYWYACGY